MVQVRWDVRYLDRFSGTVGWWREKTQDRASVLSVGTECRYWASVLLVHSSVSDENKNTVVGLVSHHWSASAPAQELPGNTAHTAAWRSHRHLHRMEYIRNILIYIFHSDRCVNDAFSLSIWLVLWSATLRFVFLNTVLIKIQTGSVSLYLVRFPSRHTWSRCSRWCGGGWGWSCRWRP